MKDGIGMSGIEGIEGVTFEEGGVGKDGIELTAEVGGSGNADFNEAAL